MASTYTTAKLLEKQGTGDNTGTWGGVLNAVLDDIDAALSMGSKSVAGSSNVTLTDDEARYAIQKYTGTLTGSIEVRPPARSAAYTVWNATDGSFELDFKTAAGNGIRIPQGAKRRVFCDGTDVFELDGAYVIPGYIAGLGMAQAADADHDITIAIGSCADSTGGFMLALYSALTKQIDASWAAGTNAGGMATGSVANSTWYHVHLIRKTSNGQIDAIFDTSISAANIPSGWVAYRRIGSVLTDGSANIVDFIQDGDYFYWVIPPLDHQGAATSATWTAKALSVPPDVRVGAFGYFQNGRGGADQGGLFALRATDASDVTPALNTGSVLSNVFSGSADQVPGDWGPVLTNTSREIAYYAAAASAQFELRTRGYIDRRGA